MIVGISFVSTSSATVRLYKLDEGWRLYFTNSIYEED